MSLKVNIKKRLKSFCLDVAFETENGIFAILGSSGCGKSMTLKCIAGIETPDEGTIELNGRILYDSAKKINLTPQERRVGYMFQDYALFPNMTVEGNIKAGMGKKPDQGKVKAYIERFHLNGLEDYYPAQLSGGQKQRVAMVRMIASEPDVLLLDEPFSALDSYLKWKLEQEMRDMLAEVDKPVLFVSHNRDEVYRLCSMVSCINHGKMEIIEEKKEFFQNPKTKTAAVLSGCKNISTVEIVDKHHIKALDWGIILSVPFVAEDINVVGIRAHSFYPVVVDKENSTNIFELNEFRIIEDSFEWNISFRPNEKSGWIQWRVAKKEQENFLKKIPHALAINGKDILLLKDKFYE